MSHINEKLGIRPAGKRSMMKLPRDRAVRNAVTSAQCPACQRWGARLSEARLAADSGRLAEVDVWCSWCNHHWTVTLPEAQS